MAMKRWPKDRPFHQSDFSTFLTCKWQFKLSRLDEVEPEARSIALVNGSAVHETIHILHTQNAWKHYADVFDEEWDEQLKRDIELPLVGEEKTEKLKVESKELIANYIPKNKDLDVVYSEVHFGDMIGKYATRGIMDQVIWTKGGKWLLRDLKTDAQAPALDYLMKNYQFGMYSHALLRGYLELPGGERVNIGQMPMVSWYQLRNLVPYKRKSTKGGITYNAGDLRGDPNMVVPITEEHMPYFESEIKKMIQQIRFGIFYREPRKTGSCVGFCRYTNACDKGVCSNCDYMEDDFTCEDFVPALERSA